MNDLISFEETYDYKNDEKLKNALLRLAVYRKALKQEIVYLNNEGSNKYRLFNGRLVSISDSYATYYFDSESEMLLVDDTPIVLTIGEVQHYGQIVACDGYSIVLRFDYFIDQYIGNATLSAVEGQLLEALEKRLRRTIDVEITQLEKMFIEGYNLPTDSDISIIPKGKEAVIQKAMNEPICIVWGPPGTGKTHTISEIAIMYMLFGKKVLIVSHSNISVDNVTKKIGELLTDIKKESLIYDGRVQRYGNIRDEELINNRYLNSFEYTISKNKNLKKQLDKLQMAYDKLKNDNKMDSSLLVAVKDLMRQIKVEAKIIEQKNVERASIVTTTIAKAISDSFFDEKKYDVVMFDEASMAYVLQIVAATTFSTEHFICVGDFMQLAPIAQSGAGEILSDDIFTYLGINRNGTSYYHPWLTMLCEQRRMHPKISAFANEYVYATLLEDHPDSYENKESIVDAEPFGGDAVNLVDLTGSYCAASKNKDNSRFNILSAFISFASALKSESNDSSVCIITPYVAQTKLIRTLKLDFCESGNTNIRCSTVHQFQGSESDVVYFDAVESYPGKKAGYLMSRNPNAVLRLINVAITRARGKLVTVANCGFWKKQFEEKKHMLKNLINYIEENGNVVRSGCDSSLEKLVESISVKDFMEFFLNPEEYVDYFKADIKDAKDNIIVSLPMGELDSKYEEEIISLLEDMKKIGIKVLIKCNDFNNMPSRWKPHTWAVDNATFPIVMIDNHITWYGVPAAPWEFADGKKTQKVVCPIVARVKGKYTAELLNSMAMLDYRKVDGTKVHMTPRYDVEVSLSNALVGLPAYVSENVKCQECSGTVRMTRSKANKIFLFCTNCKNAQFLSHRDVNQYISDNNVKCPKDNGTLTANVGPYGLYIKCDSGHYVKPEDI